MSNVCLIDIGSDATGSSLGSLVVQVAHVGLDLSHSTSLTRVSVGLALRCFGTCVLFGHDCATIPRVRSVKVATFG